MHFECRVLRRRWPFALKRDVPGVGRAEVLGFVWLLPSRRPITLCLKEGLLQEICPLVLWCKGSKEALLPIVVEVSCLATTKTWSAAKRANSACAATERPRLTMFRATYKARKADNSKTHTKGSFERGYLLNSPLAKTLAMSCCLQWGLHYMLPASFLNSQPKIPHSCLVHHQIGPLLPVTCV